MSTNVIIALWFGFCTGAALIWPIAHSFGAEKMANDVAEDMRKLRDAQRRPL